MIKLDTHHTFVVQAWRISLNPIDFNVMGQMLRSVVIGKYGVCRNTMLCIVLVISYLMIEYLSNQLKPFYWPYQTWDVNDKTGSKCQAICCSPHGVWKNFLPSKMQIWLLQDYDQSTQVTDFLSNFKVKFASPSYVDHNLTCYYKFILKNMYVQCLRTRSEI